MAFIRVEIGPEFSQKNMANLGAAEIVEKYLLAKGVDVEFMSNTEKLDEFMKLIVEHIWTESYRYDVRVKKEQSRNTVPRWE